MAVQPAVGPLDFQHCLCRAADLLSLAMPMFAEYLEKWPKQSTAQGLTNSLVNLPVKRFRHVQRSGFHSRAKAQPAELRVSRFKRGNLSRGQEDFPFA